MSLSFHTGCCRYRKSLVCSRNRSLFQISGDSVLLLDTAAIHAYKARENKTQSALSKWSAEIFLTKPCQLWVKSVEALYTQDTFGLQERKLHEEKQRRKQGVRVFSSCQNKQPKTNNRRLRTPKTNDQASIQVLLRDIQSWMEVNFLNLNENKTEIILFGKQNFTEGYDSVIGTLDSHYHPFVRTLGVIFDRSFRFDEQIRSKQASFI